MRVRVKEDRSLLVKIVAAKEQAGKLFGIVVLQFYRHGTNFQFRNCGYYGFLFIDR